MCVCISILTRPRQRKKKIEKFTMLKTFSQFSVLRLGLGRFPLKDNAEKILYFSFCQHIPERAWSRLYHSDPSPLFLTEKPGLQHKEGVCVCVGLYLHKL